MIVEETEYFSIKSWYLKDIVSNIELKCVFQQILCTASDKLCPINTIIFKINYHFYTRITFPYCSCNIFVRFREKFKNVRDSAMCNGLYHH